MTYDTDYPTKPMGGGNPYYACAYCGITDPQINGKIKNHAQHCEYRLMKEQGIKPSHNGYGQVIPEEPVALSWEEKVEIMEAEGWTIECESPLEIRHTDGTFANGLPARLTIQAVTEEYQY